MKLPDNNILYKARAESLPPLQLIVTFFFKSIGTMSASVFTTITTFQMVLFCEYHEAILKIEIFMVLLVVTFPAHTLGVTGLAY
jgi:hypothetical protein